MATMRITFPENIVYDYINDCFHVQSRGSGSDSDSNQKIDYESIARYYKGLYRSGDQMHRHFTEYSRHANENGTLDHLKKLIDEVEPFTYDEVFQFENSTFQALVFGTVDIPEMIKNLGSERISTDGKKVRNKVFDSNGEFQGYEEKHNIFEVHRISSDKLTNINNDFYALRCWCTSTDQEHYIYIEERYKDDPLQAVASTFRVPNNIIDYIHEIKRQGDVLICEMKDSYYEDGVEPTGTPEPLDKETYFKLLTCET